MDRTSASSRLSSTPTSEYSWKHERASQTGKAMAPASPTTADTSAVTMAFDCSAAVSAAVRRRGRHALGTAGKMPALRYSLSGHGTRLNPANAVTSHETCGKATPTHHHALPRHASQEPTMKDTLQPGLTFEFKYRVPENKTVPYLYPEAPEFQLMPKVL